MRKEAVSLLGLTAAILSLPVSFLSVKENRVAEGVLFRLWELPAHLWIAVLAAIVLAGLALAFGEGRGSLWIRTSCSAALLTLAIVALIFGAGPLMPAGGSGRVGPALGFWFLLGGGYIIFYDTARRFALSPGKRLAASLAVIVPIVVVLVAGPAEVLGIVQEYNNRESRFWQELLSHLALSGSSVLGSTLIGVPLGILAFRRRRTENAIFSISNGLQTIPSLALFGLLIAPLAFLGRQFPFLRAIGIRGVGNTPAIIALVLYGLLPIVRNTFTGLKTIDRAVVDAGRGMGMDKRQLLFLVQVPVSMPIILTGIRITAVQTIGNAAVAALIGARGLGNFVFQGLGQAAPDLIVLGVIPIVLLAVGVDRGMDGLIRALSPQGQRQVR